MACVSGRPCARPLNCVLYEVKEERTQRVRGFAGGKAGRPSCWWLLYLVKREGTGLARIGYSDAVEARSGVRGWRYEMPIGTKNVPLGAARLHIPSPRE